MMLQRSCRFCLLLLVCSLAQGCALGPDYTRPSAPVSEQYKETAAQARPEDWRPARPGSPDQSRWWLRFEEPRLNELMARLDAANQNVQAALANLRQARAQVRESRASLFPAIGVSSDISRAGAPVKSSGALGGSARNISNTFKGSLNASWELDLWGGTRRGVESSAAQADSSAATLGAVLLSMRAELAVNYFQLRTFDETIALYGETIDAYKRSLAITENQYRAGIVTRVDLSQAQAQLKAAEAAAVELRLQRAQTEHAIAVLVGEAPAGFSIEPEHFSAVLPRVDAGLPSVLLERRPDVAAAEQKVAAANASIGVAKAAYFPVLSLSGSRGYSSDSFHRWFISPNEVWSLGPALALSLFQGGARIAKADQAFAAWEGAVAQYRQTVLSALQEVEDYLAAVGLLENQERLQQEALEAAREAERLFLNQYQAGTVTYLSVVSAQTTALNNARAVAQLRGARFNATVALIRALGGGWDEGQMHADGKSIPVGMAAGEAPVAHSTPAAPGAAEDNAAATNASLSGKNLSR